MKDIHDKQTLDALDAAEVGECASGAPPSGAAKRKFKRLPGYSANRPPELVDSFTGEVMHGKPSKPELHADAEFAGWLGGYVVPVSFVAKDWGVSTRRVRALLCQGRLDGRLQPNGYWEVFYPYRYIMGTRGPGLKRQQRQPDKPKNPESMQERQS